ncbi:uncharacterized protein PHALS_14997 [Plasmopara halstedii]|uniref:Uncharacterized protein n=1 Tax=Plasmopara halstedii TaxID=4781 RepID=A0A0P1B0B4_PLAHL|nr:uncharacterized protein PHALS_14997 [Plasmopara halstedii]CEG47381.1 hypothetical protein PHALS_14997 [Plasmopara halstedii]|eukprot:XP_024583750.1 hypothetical protein PHALS_14997 [Plasmopara halstedii]
MSDQVFSEGLTRFARHRIDQNPCLPPKKLTRSTACIAQKHKCAEKLRLRSDLICSLSSSLRITAHAVHFTICVVASQTNPVAKLQ